MGAPPVCYAPGDGLIDPSTFPAKSGDLDTEAIRGSATHLRGLGTTLVTRTDTISSVWKGLAPSYIAPESEQVLGLMGPVTTAAGSVNDTYIAVAGKLDTYADELDAIKPRLADLERRAGAFRDEIRAAGGKVKTSLTGEVDVHWYSGGITIAAALVGELTEGMKEVPWYEHGPTVEKNDGYWGEFADLVEQVTASVATCANAINRLANPLQCTVPYEAIPAEAIMSGVVPNWGGPRPEERNCVEQVSDGTHEFTTSLAQGVGGLVLGYDPATGKFVWNDPAAGESRWSGYGQSWGGLANLVGSLAVLSSAGVVYVVGDAAGIEWGESVDSFMYDRAVVLRDVGASLISYDPYAENGDGWHLWKEEGWKQGTLAVANVGTFFIPGAGAVGGGVKGARAAQVARFTGAAADVVVDGGSWAVKGAVAAGKGTSALVRGQGWAAAMDAARFTTGGARVTGMGGVTANGVQAVHDLTKASPPSIVHPPNLPKVTDSLVPPVRPHNTGPDANIPGVHLTDDAIRKGTDSWVNQKPPVDIVDQTPAPVREPVGVGALDRSPHGPGSGGGALDGNAGAGSVPGSPGSGGVPGGSGTPGGPGGAGHPLPDIADLAHLKQGGRIAEWAQQVADRHPTLTADEVTAIYEYTTSPGDGGSTNYREMNAYLRDPSEFLPRDGAYVQSRIDLAVSGMSKLEQVSGQQFRGTDLPQGVLNDWLVGETVSDSAFGSSSLDSDVADRFRDDGNALIEIDGLTGVDVNPLSHYEGGEAEILFRPGVQFTVLERNWVPSATGGYWRFLVEEVMP